MKKVKLPASAFIAPPAVLPNGHAYRVGPWEARPDRQGKHVPARLSATRGTMFRVDEYEVIPARDEAFQDRKVTETWAEGGKTHSRWFWASEIRSVFPSLDPSFLRG